MIRINKCYINRFKRIKGSYLYLLRNGVYLSFDPDTLEYIGIEMFYLTPREVEEEAVILLNKLLSLDILEII